MKEYFCGGLFFFFRFWEARQVPQHETLTLTLPLSGGEIVLNPHPLGLQVAHSGMYYYSRPDKMKKNKLKI